MAARSETHVMSFPAGKVGVSLIGDLRHGRVHETCFSYQWSAAAQKNSAMRKVKGHLGCWYYDIWGGGVMFGFAST